MPRKLPPVSRSSDSRAKVSSGLIRPSSCTASRRPLSEIVLLEFRPGSERGEENQQTQRAGESAKKSFRNHGG